MNAILKTTKEYFPLAVQILAVLALLFNVYLASKLAPLAEDIRILFGKVEAVEQTAVRKDVLSETLQPMKEATLRIENKLDRLIERESNR